MYGFILYYYILCVNSSVIFLYIYFFKLIMNFEFISNELSWYEIVEEGG